jgi:hypothetical protein
MRSSGLPTTVSELPKLDAVGKGRGTWTAMRGRVGGEWLLVGSETEYACLTAGRADEKGLRGLGLDLADANGDGAAAKDPCGVGGHRGLRGSVIGLEMDSLSIAEMAELERLKLLPFLFIESASLLKDRER